MGRSEKVNLAFLYRNKLDLEQQTITRELNGQELPGDQVSEKFMILRLRMNVCMVALHKYYWLFID